MLVTRLSSACLVLVIASSVSATFPFSYPEFRRAQSFSPHLFYSTSINGNADLSGFSYFTKDIGGGESEVLFFTGPNSETNMNDEFTAMKDQLPLLSDSVQETNPDNKDDKTVTSDSNDFEDPARIVPLFQDENKETLTPVNKDEEATSTVVKTQQENAKDVNGLPSFVPGKAIGFDAPYPVFRLSGSSSYYPDLSTSFSGFGGFDPINPFRSKYEPYYNQLNSYQSLFHPFYPSLERDNYYDSIFPSIFDTPHIAPPASTGTTFKSGESQTQKPTTKLPLIVIDKVDRRFKEDEEEDEKKSVKNLLPGASSTQETPDKISLMTTDSVESRFKEDAEEKEGQKTLDDATTSDVSDQPKNEKETELPTSTELVTEKQAVAAAAATTTSEISPAKADDIKEPTTVPDAVAVAVP